MPKYCPMKHRQHNLERRKMDTEALSLPVRKSLRQFKDETDMDKLPEWHN